MKKLTGKDYFRIAFNKAGKLKMGCAVPRKPITDEDINDGYLTMAAIGYLIFKMDDLKHTGYYQHTLKKKGNAFLEELLKVESKIINVDVFDSQEKTDKANDEMNDSYIFFENMIHAIFKVPERRIGLFNEYMERGLEIYSS